MNTSRWRRHVMWLSVLAIVLAACGDGGETGGEGGGTTAPAEECTEPDPVRLQLQWFAQSQFAGYYVALDNGFYEAQCLEVEILEGAVEIVPQQVLATGGASSASPGSPRPSSLVRAAQTSSTSPRCSSGREPSRSPGPTPGIETPADWEEKRVGNWGFGNECEILLRSRSST